MNAEFVFFDMTGSPGSGKCAAVIATLGLDGCRGEAGFMDLWIMWITCAPGLARNAARSFLTFSSYDGLLRWVPQKFGSKAPIWLSTTRSAEWEKSTMLTCFGCF